MDLDYDGNQEIIIDALIKALKNAARYDYSSEKTVFELAKTGKYPAHISDLAESFGMMIVKVEARELQLEKTITKLERTNTHLNQEIQKKQAAARELQQERNQLEDRVRQRRGEILRSNHKMQMEVLARKRIEEEREQLIFELTEALTRMKQLKSLLPICPSCKKIKDDKGYWSNLEAYLSEHTEAEFSHGICQDCMKELYPEQYQKRYGKAAQK
jgi:chromosome segregation ATPase